MEYKSRHMEVQTSDRECQKRSLTRMLASIDVVPFTETNLSLVLAKIKKAQNLSSKHQTSLIYEHGQNMERLRMEAGESGQSSDKVEGISVAS